MSEVRRWAAWAITALALVVIVVGLLPGAADPVGDDERALAIAANLRCPFCSGESIAEAPSQIARDLEEFIVEKVDEGWSDEQIYAFFESRYGERVRLDPSFAGWGAALWLAPLALAVVGTAAIVSRRRRGQEGEPEATPADAQAVDA